jgi:hypothetical protein
MHPARMPPSRFIKMLALTMGDQLRTTVLNSIAAYESFWAAYDVELGTVDAAAGVPDDALPSGASAPDIASAATRPSANAE